MRNENLISILNERLFFIDLLLGNLSILESTPNNIFCNHFLLFYVDNVIISHKKFNAKQNVKDEFDCLRAILF